MRTKFISIVEFVKSRRQSVIEINLFFLLFFVWFVITTFLILHVSKNISFIQINHLRCFTADIFFTIFTFLGSGYILIPVALYCLYKKSYLLLAGLLMTFLADALLHNILKQYFNHPRPLSVLGKNVVETAKWITLYKNYSFPSGHTSAAFSIATFLSLNYKENRGVILISFIGACCTAYSRIYLGEHFLEDVWFGSLLGVFIACLFYIIIYDKSGKKNLGNGIIS